MDELATQLVIEHSSCRSQRTERLRPRIAEEDVGAEVDLNLPLVTIQARTNGFPHSYWSQVNAWERLAVLKCSGCCFSKRVILFRISLTSVGGRSRFAITPSVKALKSSIDDWTSRSVEKSHSFDPAIPPSSNQP